MTPGKSEIEGIAAALRAAAQEKGVDPALRSSMLALTTRLSAYVVDAGSSADVGALHADLHAARAALSWLQYKDATLASFAERMREIEKQATRRALRRFVDRKAKYYLWVLLIVAAFLACLILGNLILYYG